MAKGLSAAKAKKILKDGYVKGKPLTAKQIKYFGAIANGATPLKAINGGWLDKYESGGEVPKAQDGYKVPPRKGVRKNTDGNESTHLMKAEQLEDGTWVGFPSLFQNSDDKWIDMSSEKDWMNIYNEALKRGEVIEFGKDKEAAIKFGEGSWKSPKMKDGGRCWPGYKTVSGKTPFSKGSCQKAQDGLTSGTQSEQGISDAEYRKLYEAGNIHDPNLDEVVMYSGVDYEKYPYYNDLSAEQRKYFDDDGPIGRGVRRAAYTKRGLAEDTYDVVNPLMYGMLGLAGGMVAGPSIATLGRAAAGPIGRALSYKPLGGPVSIGNVIDGGSAAYAAYETPEAYDKFKENPNFDTGTDLALTAMDLIPFSEIFTGGKNIKKLYNKGKDLFTNDLKPNPDMYYRGIGQSGLDDITESGLLRAKPADQIPFNGMGTKFDFAKRFNNLYVTPRLNVADRYGRGVVAEIPKDVANFSKRYKNSDWSMMTDNQIPIEEVNLYKKNFFGNYKPVNIPQSPLSSMPFSKPNIFPTSSPLPISMEPYLSRKIYPFNKEQEIFESFLSTKNQLKNIDSKSINYGPDGNIIPNKEYGGEVDKAQWGKLLKLATKYGKDAQRTLRNFIEKDLGVKDKIVKKVDVPGTDIRVQAPTNLARVLDNVGLQNITGRSSYLPSWAQRDDGQRLVAEALIPSGNLKLLYNPKGRYYSIPEAFVDNPLTAGRTFKVLEDFIPKGGIFKQGPDGTLSTDSFKLMMNRLKSDKFSDVTNYNDPNLSRYLNNYGRKYSTLSSSGHDFNNQQTQDILYNLQQRMFDLQKQGKVGEGFSGFGIRNIDSNINQIGIPNLSIRKNYQEGGVIEDDRGQWAYPGEITKINSNNITMKGINYPVLGISDTGDKKMMQPGKDYKFDGNSVTEYPMAKDGKSLVELNQLTNFTNYNTPQPGGWLNKYN